MWLTNCNFEYANRNKTVLLLSAQMSIILRLSKNYHKTRATPDNSRCSVALKKNVIIIGGQDLSDLCEDERVDAFIGLNI